jgi:hypothetical protein
MRQDRHSTLLCNALLKNKGEDSKIFMQSHLIIAVIICLFHLTIHGPFLIVNYFGEQDAARIGIDSIVASLNGNFETAEYGVRSSPLYNDVIRYAIQSGVISYSDIPVSMAIVSLIASTVIAVSMFSIVFHLTLSYTTALLATIFFQTSPIFWLNSIYGFPTIVALAFFLVAFILFQRSVGEDLLQIQYFRTLISLILFTLAVMIKVDILLASGILCLPVWRSERSLKTKIIWTLCLAVFTGFVFLLFNQYGEILINSSHTSTFFIKDFNKTFPSEFGNLVTRKHLALSARAFGLLSIPAAILAVAVVGWRREWRITSLWLIFAALPLLLFWGMKPGNIARHYLIPSFFVYIIIVLPVVNKKRLKLGWIGLLCFVCLVNYFYFPPSSTPRYPSGQLFASAGLLEGRVRDLHSKGKKISTLPYDKIAVIGKAAWHPYFMFELLRCNKLSYVTHVSQWEFKKFEMKNRNRNKTFLMLYSAEMSRIVDLYKDGYFIIICDEEDIKKLKEYSILRDKWVYIEDLK